MRMYVVGLCCVYGMGVMLCVWDGCHVVCMYVVFVWYEIAYRVWYMWWVGVVN